MRAQTPKESVHAIDLGELQKGDISFFSLTVNGEVGAIGALKRMSATEAELKSMHVASVLRGQGVGRALLDGLIAHARDQRIKRLWLETGAALEFAPARSLYASAGFVECGPFGTYTPDPVSIFMTRNL